MELLHSRQEVHLERQEAPTAHAHDILADPRTDFADRYERQILPLLRAGYLVLCDRYIFTALARDAVRGVDRDWVEQLYSFAVHPDIRSTSAFRWRPP
ncbi:MAG: hypothetical protein WDN28_27455 [Chthoniobacter sp.]